MGFFKEGRGGSELGGVPQLGAINVRGQEGYWGTVLACIGIRWRESTKNDQ